MPKKTTIACDTLGDMLVKASREFNLRLLRNFRDAGLEITPEQWAVLMQLMQKDAQCQQDLATLTNKDMPSMTRLVDNLEKYGLVQRLPDPSDRRMKRIHLTKDGKCLQKDLVKMANKTIEEATAGISKKDLSTIKNTLNKIIENLIA